MSDEYSVNDMVDAVNQENPTEFKAAFNNVMKDKISAALMAKRDELATSTFDSNVDINMADDEIDEPDIDED